MRLLNSSSTSRRPSAVTAIAFGPFISPWRTPAPETIEAGCALSSGCPSSGIWMISILLFLKLTPTT